MSKILYEVYQNDIKDSESVMFGKWYARLKSIETLNTERLAKHISEHGSVFTADVVEGVMKKVKTCLLEMLLESKKVKIAGLGTFYLIKKADFVNIKSLLSGKAETEGEGGDDEENGTGSQSQGGTQGGSQNQGGTDNTGGGTDTGGGTNAGGGSDDTGGDDDGDDGLDKD